MIGKLGDRAAGNGGSTSTKDDSDNGDGEDKKGFIGHAAEKLGEGASPVGAAVKGLGSSIKEKVTGLFKRKGGSKRPTNIVEDCFVGVPPEVAFAAWTEFQEFPSYMKGPENVSGGEEKGEEETEEGKDPHEDTEMSWTAKIFVNRRSWKSNMVDYDPPNRLSWTSEGNKGTIDGTITFTAIGDNATLMLFVMEYRSKGPIEWIGNRWRTVGRRVRLDIKHFRRYVMRTEPDELPEPEEEPEETEEEPPTDKDQEPEEAQEEEPEAEDEEEPEEEPEAEEEEPAPRPARRARKRVSA